MVVSVFELDVSYNQIAVFCSSLTQPFNDWTEQHVAQGFAWRSGSVSFRTMVEFGVHSVKVAVVKHLETIEVNVIRAIQVPFEVPADGLIEVASISDSKALALPAGLYSLRCEFIGQGANAEEMVHLLFASADTPQFALVKADDRLFPGVELVTFADAAK